MGVTYYGDKGALKFSVWSYDHKETELFAAPGNRAQLLNFVQCRKSSQRPIADIKEGHISSACCILANLSMELGRGLRWDAEADKVIGDDEANRRLARAYRSPWTHPTPETV